MNGCWFCQNFCIYWDNLISPFAINVQNYSILFSNAKPIWFSWYRLSMGVIISSVYIVLALSADDIHMCMHVYIHIYVWIYIYVSVYIKKSQPNCRVSCFYYFLPFISWRLLCFYFSNILHWRLASLIFKPYSIQLHDFTLCFPLRTDLMVSHSFDIQYFHYYLL